MLHEIPEPGRVFRRYDSKSVWKHRQIKLFLKPDQALALKPRYGLLPFKLL